MRSPVRDVTASGLGYIARRNASTSATPTPIAMPLTMPNRTTAAAAMSATAKSARRSRSISRMRSTSMRSIAATSTTPASAASGIGCRNRTTERAVSTATRRRSHLRAGISHRREWRRCCGTSSRLPRTRPTCRRRGSPRRARSTRGAGGPAVVRLAEHVRVGESIDVDDHREAKRRCEQGADLGPAHSLR